MLQNASLVAKFRFDTAENEVREEWCVVASRQVDRAVGVVRAQFKASEGAAREGIGMLNFLEVPPFRADFHRFSHFLQIYKGLVLGWIDSYDSNQILIFSGFSRSTKLSG